MHSRSTASALFEQTQQTRQRNVAKACARMTFKKSKMVVPDWSEMYVDDDRRYVYCLVSKVSCTSWKRTLLWMTGKVPSRYSSMYDMPIGYIHNHAYNDQVMHRLINLVEPEVERRLYGGDYYKFLFVREPLDRVVSAYRDKILADPAYHIDDYILKHHRTKQSVVNNSTERSSTSRPASAAGSERSSKNMTRNQSASINATVVTEAMPTFAEFIDYVLAERDAGKRLDRHWLPQSELCSPCLVNYDFIGHQESLHADAEYVLDILRQRRAFNSTTKPLPSKYTEVRFPDSDSSHGYEEVELERRKKERKDKSDRAVNEMLAQLSDVTFRRIVDLYDADYQLFGFKRPTRHNSR